MKGEGREIVEGVGIEGREGSPWILFTPPHMQMKSSIKPCLPINGALLILFKYFDYG